MRHGLAEGVGRPQLILGFGAAAGVTAQLEQRGGGDQGQNQDQCGRDIGQPGAAAAIGHDVESEPVAGQVEADGAGNLAIRRPHRGVAEHLAVRLVDHRQAVAGGKAAGQRDAQQSFERLHGDEGAQVAAALLHRHDQVVGPALVGTRVVGRKQRAVRAQGLLQRAKADPGQLLADEGDGRFIGCHPFDLAFGADPDDGADFRIVADVTAGTHLEGFVSQLAEFLLAPEFGQEILMRVQARLDGALGPVHVAFECREGGILFAPLEQPGDDQHGERKDADGDVGREP